MNGVHRQSRQAVQWRAFNRNAEGDKGVVDHSPAVADLVVRARARDLEVGEVDEFGEGGDE